MHIFIESNKVIRGKNSRSSDGGGLTFENFYGHRQYTHQEIWRQSLLTRKFFTHFLFQFLPEKWTIALLCSEII